MKFSKTFWNRVSNNSKVIELLKERQKLEKQILKLDKMALLRYELEALQKD